jgi:hypothetical protein
MRALAAIQVFRENREGTFELTAMGQFLRDDIAGTHAAIARLFGSRQNWTGWGALLHAVRTGEVAFDHLHGCGVWEYRRQHPDEAQTFDRAMTSGTEYYADAVMKAIDLSRFRRIVDVGGGDGIFLAKILAAHPHIYGTLFDRPSVVANAAALLESFGVADRCSPCGGDFFEEVPPGEDAYLLKWIVHDWDDERAVAILKTIRHAMSPTSRLLIVEHVVAPPNRGAEGKFLDLMMMVMTGGRERNREEFSALFSAAGFRLNGIVPTGTVVSILDVEMDPMR